MSTAIRPPGGPSSIGSTSEVAAPAELEGAREVESSAPTGHATAVEHTSATSAVAATELSSVDNPTAVVLGRLDAGEITREQAIESLIAEAITSHGASSLPLAQRTELESIMRTALLEDPTLARLLG